MLKEFVNSLNDLKHLVSLHEPTAAKIILLFMASIDPETGKSWCPDCRDADPVVNDTLDSWSKTSPSSILITVYVGERANWKNPSNIFRGEPYFIKAVPTLMIHGKEGRLEEGQLLSPDGITKFLDS